MRFAEYKNIKNEELTILVKSVTGNLEKRTAWSAIPYVQRFGASHIGSELTGGDLASLPQRHFDNVERFY